MAIVMAMVILSSSRSAKGSDGGYSDEGGDDGNGDGDGDGDSQCKFNGEKRGIQNFFSTLPSFLGSVEFWHFGPPLAFYPTLANLLAL